MVHKALLLRRAGDSASDVQGLWDEPRGHPLLLLARHLDRHRRGRGIPSQAGARDGKGACGQKSGGAGNVGEVPVAAGEDDSRQRGSSESAVSLQWGSEVERHGMGEIGSCGSHPAGALVELLLPRSWGECGVLHPRFDPPLSSAKSGRSIFTQFGDITERGSADTFSVTQGIRRSRG